MSIRVARWIESKRDETYVNLDVEILEVESVLPDIDTDDRDQV